MIAAAWAYGKISTIFGENSRGGYDVTTSDARMKRVVNFAIYPLAEPESALRSSLLKVARYEMEERGLCILPSLLQPNAIRILRDEVAGLTSQAHRHSGVGTAYLQPPNPALPPNDPRRIETTYRLGAVANDRIPSDSPIRLLYEWPPFLDFLASILGESRIYQYGDPLSSLSISVMVPGDRLDWHFDEHDFVVSVAIQAADEGGAFEVVPLIRSSADPRYDDVACVLLGGRTSVESLTLAAGTVLVFRGRDSLHRVTEVRGSSSRLMALLSYDIKPGTQDREEVLLTRYGRLA